MKITGKTLLYSLVFGGISVLSGCADKQEMSAVESESVLQTAPEPLPGENTATPCVEEPGIRYLCGLINAEDILPLSGTPWVLVSGMSGELSNDDSINGKIHLVNREDNHWEILFPGAAPVMAYNQDLYGDCPGPLDASNFSAHGMAVKTLDTGPAQFRLYMTSHGAREAVEVFEIDALVTPTIKWIGCIPMPVTSWTNSVVILNDWGFFATQFMDPTGSGMAGVNDRQITGHVFEWHPGKQVSVLTGTDLSGPNGIEMSGDERYLFVAAYGTNEVVRFDRSSTPVGSERASVGISPDNVRWSENGSLYVAGGNIAENCGAPTCGSGWSVWEVVPFNMSISRLTGADASVTLQGVSAATQLGSEIWIGTFGGNRLGIIPQP